MKIDVLAFAAHPDDAELACSGTLAVLKSSGHTTGIVDLTQGEMGTRGSREERMEEAARSSEILGLDYRANLNLGDTSFEINRENQLRIIEQLRHCRPSIIFINAKTDRHIDHPRAGELVKQAAFLSGLRNIETEYEGQKQVPWRPEEIFHYIQYQYIKPDFVVDISEAFNTKMESIKAFKSQFFDPNSSEPETLISSEPFIKYIEGRAREMGSSIEKEFGEGFNVIRPLPVDLSKQFL